MKRLITYTILFCIIFTNLNALDRKKIIAQNDKRIKIKLIKKNHNTLFIGKKYTYVFEDNSNGAAVAIFTPISIKQALHSGKRNLQDTYKFLLEIIYRFFKDFNVVELDKDNLIFMVMSKENDPMIAAFLSKKDIMKLVTRDFSTGDLDKKNVVPLKEVLKNARIASADTLDTSIYHNILLNYNFGGFIEGVIEDKYYDNLSSSSQEPYHIVGTSWEDNVKLIYIVCNKHGGQRTISYSKALSKPYYSVTTKQHVDTLHEAALLECQ